MRLTYPTLLLLTTLSLMPQVLADGTAIVSAMDKIINTTLAFQATLAPWTGNPLTLLPIVVQSAELLAAINAATKVAKASANLTDLEVLGIAGATVQLAGDVNATLTTIMAKKKYFQRELLQPVILLELLAEKKATDAFGNAVVAKVPAILQSVAKTEIAPIDMSFSLAIADYEKL